METHLTEEGLSDRRSETRASDSQYYSVQFTAEGLLLSYQFKLWNVSQKGMCILVKESSEVLNHLAVGDTIEMIYYRTDTHGESNRLNTQIKHITPNSDGRFGGHCLVGLAIL